MKVLVLLSLVALCFSIPLTLNRQVSVREDGTITIIDDQNREIHITGNTIDPRKVDIVLKSPQGVPRRIEIDEANNIRDVDFSTLDTIKYLQNPTYLNVPRDQVTQVNILKNLFREYEGVVNQRTYEILLEKIKYLVNSGVIHGSVLDVLKNFEQWHMMEEMRYPQMTINTQDYITLKDQIAQGGVLADLFRQYEAIVDQQSYEIFMEKVKNMVESGLIRGTVFDVLRNFQKLHLVKELKMHERTTMAQEYEILDGQMTEGSILSQLFHQFENIVDQETYEIFMEKVRYLVKTKLIQGTVFDVLRHFNQLHLIEVLHTPQVFINAQEIVSLEVQLAQGGVLSELFQQFEKVEDEQTFEILLEKIKYLVKSGLIRGTVFDVLRNLHQLHMIQVLKGSKMLVNNYVTLQNQMIPGGVLADLFRQYETIIDEQTYQEFIQKVKYLVQTGAIRGTVYEILKNLEQMHLIHILNKPHMFLNTLNYNSVEDKTIVGNMMVQLYRQYESVVDEQTYEMLVEKIKTLIQTGAMHGTVFDVLRNLKEMHMLYMLRRPQMLMNNQEYITLEGQMNQVGVLRELFQQYKQIVDQESYEIFMQKVKNLVYTGAMRATVFDVLKYFRHMETIEVLQRPEILINSPYYIKLQNLLTQDVTFANLYRQYENVVDEETYEMLMQKINYLVKSGLVQGTVFDVLRNLEQLHLIQVLKGQRTIEYGDVIPRTYYRDADLPLQNRVGLLNEVRNVMPIQAVESEYLRNADLKYRNIGLQGLWKTQTLTPFQHFRMLVQEKGQGLRQEQTVTTPWDRYMTTLRGQGYNTWTQQGIQQQVPVQIQKLTKTYFQKQTYPQQWTKYTPQKYVQQVFPQQWTEEQVIPQQWTKQVVPQQWTKQVVPQQWTEEQVIPQQWTKHVVPQQWTEEQVIPQQWAKQVIPQQWATQVIPQQWTNQVIPQQWTKQVVPQQWTEEQVIPQQLTKEVIPQQWAKQVVPQQWTEEQVIPQQWAKKVVPQQWADKVVLPQRNQIKGL